MQRVVDYSSYELGVLSQDILKPEDGNLVSDYLLGGNSSFTFQESRLDISFYKGYEPVNGGDDSGPEVLEDATFLETVKDAPWYSILGINKGSEAQEITVKPAEDCLRYGYNVNNMVVEYKAYDYLYYRGGTLYISEISSDRTEIRVKSMVLEESELRDGATKLYSLLHEQPFLTEIDLDFQDKDQKAVIINSMLETIDESLVLTLKLYEPLPLEIVEKDLFEIIIPLGEPVRFLVNIKETYIEDPPLKLRGPNYRLDLGRDTLSTPYILYRDLLGSGKVYRPYKDNYQVSINHKDLTDFIHFSSAVERLENAKYKFELIQSYEIERDKEGTSPVDQERYNELINNIKANFDHYEVYLYEKDEPPYTWPKDNEGNLLSSTSDEVLDWFKEAYERAEEYDRNNPDILVNSVPDTIRDTEESEPYIAFVHMIGQHFDDVWIYLKGLAEKYNADNRLDFGVSRDIVKDAIRDFSVDIYESNQNLNKLFELAQEPDSTRITELRGDETSVEEYIRVPDVEGEQPIDKDTYNKELYKRIYHNIPALIKTKGTSRCIRVLLNCFGIPDDILDVKVAGGIPIEPTPYFGPQELINSGTIGLLEKVRTGSVSTVKDVVNGEEIDKAILSQYRTIQNVTSSRSDDSHQVEIGFDLGKATDEYLKSQLPEFRFDDVFGDPGNREQDYGDICRNIREKIMGEVDGHFRSPAAIIRLVRYFDVALFRSVVDNFIPARATTAIGAIVKDNFLHRSRWQGVDVNWINETYSGSTETGFITGSTGGTMEVATTTSHSLVLSNGIAYFSKSIDDESPKYNGELSGSYIEVTDGWLTEGNPYNKTNPLGLKLVYNFKFMDLPEMPYCIIAAWNTTYKYTVFYINTKDASSFPEIESRLDYAGGNKYLATIRFTSAEDSTYIKVSRDDIIGTPKSFLGWYKGTNPNTILNNPGRMGISGSNWLQNSTDYYNLKTYGCPSEIQAVYAKADRLRIKASILHETGTYEYSYGARDIVALTIGQCDNDGNPGVWKQLGNVYVTVEITGSRLTAIVPTSSFGETPITYKTDISCSNINQITAYGFSRVNNGTSNYVGAFGTTISGSKQYVSADWFDTYGEWVPWVPPTSSLELDENKRMDFIPGNNLTWEE